MPYNVQQWFKIIINNITQFIPLNLKPYSKQYYLYMFYSATTGAYLSLRVHKNIFNLNQAGNIHMNVFKRLSSSVTHGWHVSCRLEIYKAIPTRPKKSQEENIFKALCFASRSFVVKYRTSKKIKYIYMYKCIQSKHIWWSKQGLCFKVVKK